MDSYQLTRLHNKIDKIAHLAKRSARAVELNAILSHIEFEHKKGYQLEVLVDTWTQGYLMKVIRNVPDSRTGDLTDVNNSRRLNADVTDDQFIKELFCAVGQFEAHEFAESFRYKGRHAYFPHAAKEGHALYGQGEALNSRLLNVWRDVRDDRSDWVVAFRYAKRGFDALPIVVRYKELDQKLYWKMRAMRTKVKEYFQKAKMRLELRINGLRARIDNAIKAFQLDPMDMPVSIQGENSPQVSANNADKAA